MIETSNAGSASALLPPTDSVVAAEAQRERPAPANAEEWVLLGQRQLKMGQGEQAISSFKRAVELEPAVALHWGRLGKALAAKRRYDAAEPVLQRACALDPSQSVLHVALAEVLVQQNKTDAAIEACQRALSLDPDNIAAAVTEALILPPVYGGTADLRMWRNRFAEALGRLHARKSHWLARPHGVLRVDMANFYLAYQGGDDRALQSSYSDFLAALLGAAVPELQAPIKPRSDRSAKIRIGFLSSHLRTSTIGDYFGSWITDLPRDRFHLCTLFTGGLSDPHAEALAQASDEPVSVVGPAEEVARIAKSLALDILVFPDVGMTLNSSLLVNLRLAPVQCAAWGHPVTTGSRFIDYFLSCGDMEPADAATHYREELVLLPGLGTRYPRLPRVEKAERDRFGLPRQANLPVSAAPPQNPPGYRCSVLRGAGARRRCGAGLLRRHDQRPETGVPGPPRGGDEAARPVATPADQGAAIAEPARFPAGHERVGCDARYAALERRQLEPRCAHFGAADRHLAGSVHARPPERGDASPPRRRGPDCTRCRGVCRDGIARGSRPRVPRS